MVVRDSDRDEILNVVLNTRLVHPTQRHSSSSPTPHHNSCIVIWGNVPEQWNRHFLLLSSRFPCPERILGHCTLHRHSCIWHPGILKVESTSREERFACSKAGSISYPPPAFGPCSALIPGVRISQKPSNSMLLISRSSVFFDPFRSLYFASWPFVNLTCS